MLLKRYVSNKPFLARSKFRSSFRLDENDLVYINKAGLDKIKEHAVDFVEQRLAPAFPYRDGKQTPYSGHPVFKAQHAVGCCCRSCLMKWYGISKGRKLMDDEVKAITEILMKWIEENFKRSTAYSSTI